MKVFPLEVWAKHMGAHYTWECIVPRKIRCFLSLCHLPHEWHSTSWIPINQSSVLSQQQSLIGRCAPDSALTPDGALSKSRYVPSCQGVTNLLGRWQKPRESSVSPNSNPTHMLAQEGFLGGGVSEPDLGGRGNRNWSRTQGGAVLPAVVVNFMCRLDWAEGCSDSW